MKKLGYIIILSPLLMLFFCFCTKKKSSTNTSNNNNSTTNGTPTQTINPCTQNSTLVIGGSGWSNITCASTSSLSLKSINGLTDITVTFASPPTSGTYYQVYPSVGVGGCTIILNNAPSQPAGVIWYGIVGSVSVTTSATGIIATFVNVQCEQYDFIFPRVTLNGFLECN